MRDVSLDPELARAAGIMLEQVMGVQEDEHLVITADTASDYNAINAVQAAAHRCGASATVVTMPRLPFQGALSDPYVPDPVKAAVANCDVWIDMAFPYLAGSGAFDASMAGGRTRYLLAADLKTESMIRIFGRVDMDKLFAATEAFDALLTEKVGKEVRITNELGSDVTFNLGPPIAMGCGKAVEPGPSFVPGCVMIMPDEDTVKGKLVFESVFHEYYTKLPDRITLEVDGKVKGVHGGGSESTVLERALRRASGGNDLGYLIHFTCGFHPSARFAGESIIEDMRTVGFNACGLGLPFWTDEGGENHPDAIISRQSLWIDGQQITDNGTFVGDDELGKLARDLTPIYTA